MTLTIADMARVWDEIAAADRAFILAASLPRLSDGMSYTLATFKDKGRRKRVYKILRTADPHIAGDTRLPLRTNQKVDQVFTEIPDGYVLQRTSSNVDPMLHSALMDLARLIRWDVTKAAEAAYYGTEYPGVDEGIVPVSDDHIALVAWATQRELDRELRQPEGLCLLAEKLPAIQIGEFPWSIQRAFAERRRKHYTDYGIGHQQWEENWWTPDGVAEDPDFLPPWIEEK